MRVRGTSPDAAPHAFALVGAVPNALDTPASRVTNLVTQRGNNGW